MLDIVGSSLAMLFALDAHMTRMLRRLPEPHHDSTEFFRCGLPKGVIIEPCLIYRNTFDYIS